MQVGPAELDRPGQKLREDLTRISINTHAPKKALEYTLPANRYRLFEFTQLSCRY